MTQRSTYTYPVHKYKGKWYFWNETWSDRHGPYESVKEALSGCSKYLYRYGKVDINNSHIIAQCPCCEAEAEEEEQR